MLDAHKIIFLIIAIFAFFEFFCSERVRNVNYWISVFVIIILYSIRDYSIGAGGDTEAYVRAYNEIGKLDFGQIVEFNWELGYVVLNKIMFIIFGGNERCFVVLMEILIVLPIAEYVKRVSPLPNFCLLFFVALGGIIHTGLFRQMLAFSIILYSLRYLEEQDSDQKNNFIKFFSIILVASLFHVTALLFSLVFFVKSKVSAGALLTSFVVSLLVYLLGPSIYNLLIKLSRIDYAMVTDGGINKVIFLYLIALMEVVFCRKVINNNYKIDGKLFMIAVALQPFCLVFGLASRVLIYCELSTMIVMSIMLDAFLKRVADSRGVIFVSSLAIFLTYGIFICQKYQQYLLF